MPPQQDRIFSRDFLFISIGLLAFIMAFFMINPVLPLYVKQHGGSPSLVGALVGGSSLVSLAVRPFIGRLVDTKGRRRFLLLGAACLVLATIGYDSVVNIPTMWIPRLLAGAGIAMFLTAAMAYAADIAPPHRRGEAMGYFGMWTTIGLAIGPLLALWLVTSPGLHGVERPLARWLPGRGSDVDHGEFNFALVFVVACILAMVGLATVRRLREVYRPVPRPSQGLRRSLKTMFDGAGVLPGAVNCLLTMNIVALNVFVPLYSKEVGVANPGLFYTCSAAAVVAVRLWGGRMLDRFPRAYVIIPALGVAMAGTLMIALVHHGWMLFIGGAVIGAGQGLAQPGLQALVVDRARKDRIGAATATFNVGSDIGLGAGGYLMGVVLQVTDYATMWTVAGLGPGVAMVVLGAATLRARTVRRAAAAAP